MNHFEDPIRIVRELKGAALSVMVLLSLTPVPVTQKWLEIHSGYTDKPVSDALYYLREHGFVIKNQNGWILSRGIRQLPLPFSQVEEEVEETEPEAIDGDLTDSNPEQENESQNISNPDNSDKNGQCRKVSDPLTSSSINNIDSKDSNTTNKPTRKNSDSPDHIPVIRCLAEHGISLNLRTRPLLGHITCDDILTVHADLARRGLEHESGLFVVRLEQRARYGAGSLQRTPTRDPTEDDEVQLDYRRYSQDLERYKKR